jgi:hypothetical protein
VSGGTGYSAGDTLTQFDPAVAGPGTHNLTYEYSVTGGCTAICNFSIIVNPKPELACPVDPDACPSPTPLPLTGAYAVAASPTGGTGVYTGTGVLYDGWFIF